MFFSTGQTISMLTGLSVKIEIVWPLRQSRPINFRLKSTERKKPKFSAKLSFDMIRKIASHAV